MLPIQMGMPNDTSAPGSLSRDSAEIRKSQRSRTRRLVLREVGRFMLAGLLAACLIGVGTFIVANRDAEAQAIAHAEDITSVEAKGVVQPALTTRLLDGSPSSTATLDSTVAARVLNGDVVRVKVWDSRGTILYSDEHRLIGQRFDLGSRELTTFRTGQPDADVSDLSEEENRYEAHFGKLLEVYLPIDVEGKPVLFETYQRYSAISQYQQAVWLSFLPVLVGGLALLFIVEIPLAGSLARRLSRLIADHEALLNRTLGASERERRRIAGDLHDGVVQNLMAVATSLGTTARRLEKEDQDTTTSVRSAEMEVRQAMGELRTLIIEIAPPNLAVEGIANAISDLLDPLRNRGIAADLSVADDLNLSPHVLGLLFRVAQEALRNVSKHADAQHVFVRLFKRRDRLRLEVEDDGKGFSPADLMRRRAEGHVGLSLLQDLVADAQGTVKVDSKPGGGTLVVVEMSA
jgi:two-component system NarL family sensor kinase